MDYQYEQLGDERFQQLCNILISKEYPNIQAFPVGQPDGGRDAVVYSFENKNKPFVVFQIKFVRSPESKDIIGWLEKIIDGESNKIARLIQRGATSYHILTNVRGSGHLDNGTMDRVNNILQKKIPIPAICWWREDLNILVTKDTYLKWSFLEILNGQDILNSVLFSSLNEANFRRESAIKAYLTDQYSKDNEVKFSQIDLKSRLFDLFIDVPLAIKKFNSQNRLLQDTVSLVQGVHHDFMLDEEFESTTIGAAEFLLNAQVQTNIEKMLLEGGPGQGKSTISQFVSQVHRLKLLNKKTEIEALPVKFRLAPTRLPFKIDLRHLAAWLEGKNPYPDDLNESYFSRNRTKSLESFLVGHIFSHSKQEGFSTADLLSIIKDNPILLVFDGFDEIADLQMRSQVITAIEEGINRLKSQARSVQVLVTSRPAAFTDLIGFSIDDYPHFELKDINITIINEYLEKWIKAIDLNITDAIEMRRLVRDKLQLPHLKELAKSPMQLAILISLLRTKGESLPNQRTTLYDNYIQLFFDRESTKSALVLSKRVLIIQIHQYLAWLLHSEAESQKNSGIIQFDELIKHVQSFLIKDGHDAEIAGQLFNVVKERVCALVSRVQGTFEFEVQPLREYFCGKYLYSTAPYSNAGNPKRGTKPERLYAILRNFYWQNVVRFFVGCADRGELDMIIQELYDLESDEIFHYTNYPVVITSQILSDYVFYPALFKTRAASAILTKRIESGRIINQDLESFKNERITLSPDCGLPEVVEECFKQLKKFPHSDQVNQITTLCSGQPNVTLPIWSQHYDEIEEPELARWLSYGLKLGLSTAINDDVIIKILKTLKNKSEIHDSLRRLTSAKRFDLIESNYDVKALCFEALLMGRYKILSSDTSSTFMFLSTIFHPYILSKVFTKENRQISFAGFIGGFFESSISEIFSPNWLIKDEFDKKIGDIHAMSLKFFNQQIEDFKSRLELWDEIVETARKIIGECELLKIVAIIAVRAKPNNKISLEFADLHNQNLSLCWRIRFARMKSGNIKFWAHLLEEGKDLIFTLTIFFRWATMKTIIALLDVVDDQLNLLNDEEYDRLVEMLENVSYDAEINGQDVEKLISIGKPEKLRALYLLNFKLDENLRSNYICQNITLTTKATPKLRNSVLSAKIDQLLSGETTTTLMAEIRNLYIVTPTFEYYYLRSAPKRQRLNIPYDFAKKIVIESNSYPKIVCSLAEDVCRRHANQVLKPVGEIAIAEGWFDD